MYRDRNKKGELKNKNERGFIALISAIIISATLVALVLVTGTSSFFARFDALGGEFKRISLGLAESCINETLLRLSVSTDPLNYETFDEVVPLGTDGVGNEIECVIKEIDNPGSVTRTIRAWASYQGSFSNVSTAVTVQDPEDLAPDTGRVFVTIQVLNEQGGSANANDFIFSVTNATPSSYAGNVGGVNVAIPVGTPYQVAVTDAPSGYVQKSITANTCGTTSGLLAGETKICNIVYRELPTTATLTLIANVKNNNGGTLSPGTVVMRRDGTRMQSGSPENDLTPGPYTITAESVSGYTRSSTWGGPDPRCAGGVFALNAGDNVTCIIEYDDDPPPGPSCADTVMMLDRSYSMFTNSAWIPDEKAAAKALVDLYSTVDPNPKIGVGRFGDVATGRAAEIFSMLSTAYNTIKNAIDNGLPQNPISYTNLAAAINVGEEELTSVRHDADKEKVLIIISDGDPNEPTGSADLSTGFKAPTANVSGDAWANPAGAYGSGTAVGDNGETHRYQNHGFSIPNDATIQGIETRVNARVVGQVAQTDTGFVSPSNQAADSGGDGNGFEIGASNAFADGGTAAFNSNGSGDRHRFFDYNLSIPSGAIVTGIEVRPDWWTESVNAANSVNIELSWNGGSSWTSVQTNSAESTSDTNNKIVGGSSNTWGRVWGVSDFTNANFRVRITTNCSGGFTSGCNNRDFSLDWIPVRVHYVPATCQLGVAHSWNGGSSWSDEKTQSLTDTLTTYTLGDDDDGWRSGSWSPSQLSDANFRTRVRAIGATPECHIDSLETRVHYRVNTTPDSAATAAADAAKADGTNIYTIHFGDAGSGEANRHYLASLANNSTYQSGGITSSEVMSLAGNSVSPNQWSNPNNALTNDSQYATENTNGHQQGYSNFTLNVPPGATVNGIRVEVEARSSDSSGCQIGAALSSDGGTTFTTGNPAAVGVSGFDQVVNIGGNGTLWGRTWTSSSFLADDFVVRLQYVDPGQSCTNGSTLSVDRIQARVYYTVNTENGDGDNFFISPTSADMEGIFNFIGAEVCPAVNAPPEPPGPDTATIIVITDVINNNGGSRVASDFTVYVDAENPSDSEFDGEDAPGISITVSPGSYDISQENDANYSQTVGSQCSGTIDKGDTITCTIMYDDLSPPPPPPPPPPPNINIGSWFEEP